jgi:outer membrane protein assembly factor BamB
MRPKFLLTTANAALAIAVLALGITGEAQATDWPRFRGAELSATSPDQSLDRWPTNGLGLVWRVPSTVAGGYGSFAVSEGKVFTLRNLLTNSQPKEFCVALDAVSGAQVWATALGRQMAYSTPTVEARRVYAYGGELKLFCLDAGSGAILWQRDLCNEFGSMTAQNSQSPCVEGGRVFVSISAPTNCLLAFNATNGALLWRGHTNALTYGSPIGATVHGVRQIVFPDRFGLVSVAPDSGQMLWRHRSGNSYEQGPSPLLYDDIGIWVPTDPAGGGEAFRILCSNGVFSTVRLWTNATLSGTYVTLVIHAGYLYGVFGSSLQCLDLVTGQLQWRTNAVSNGSLILMENRLVCLTEASRLVRARASPLGYEPISSFTPLPATPAVPCMNSAAASDGRIYAGNPGEIVCLDAAIPAPLKLNAARIAQSGALRLTLSSSDGRPIYTNRVPQLGIRWTSDLQQPLDAWSPLPAALVYSNGVLCCEQSLPSDGPARFYSAVEEGR